jgi:hypothetical protein
MKLPAKTLVSFLLAVLVFACVMFPSPANAGVLTSAQQQCLTQERVTIVPPVPPEILKMMSPYDGYFFSQYFEGLQPILSPLDSAIGSQENYCYFKRLNTGIVRFFVKTVNFLIIQKNDKQEFMKIMEQKVLSKM